MTNYSHPKCYARSTNDCSDKISKEHFVSNNLLKDFEKDNKVKVTGLPWIQAKTFTLSSRNNMVSNILCTNHNNLLSPYDSEAGTLNRCIRDFDADFNTPTPLNEERQFNGNYIEKWMLKTVCGLIASKQIAQNGQRQNNILLKDVYVDILFNNAILPPFWGMYLKIPDNGQIHKFDCVSVLPMTANNEVKMAEFLFNNFVFNLLLGTPNDPKLCGIYRISKIHFTDGTARKTIIFEWDGPQYDMQIEITRTGTSSEHPSGWENYLKK